MSVVVTAFGLAVMLVSSVAISPTVRKVVNVLVAAAVSQRVAMTIQLDMTAIVCDSMLSV